jgi:hypothetical protein
MTDDQPLENSDSLDQLRAQYAELAALAGSLAHEIKNPLSVIRMNMDLLAEDFAQPATPRERRALAKIDMVGRQCERLETLLNDFLRFNKVGRLELHLSSLNDQVERVLDLFEPQAIQTGVEIVRYLDADLPSILLNAETPAGLNSVIAPRSSMTMMPSSAASITADLSASLAASARSVARCCDWSRNTKTTPRTAPCSSQIAATVPAIARGRPRRGTSAA